MSLLHSNKRIRGASGDFPSTDWGVIESLPQTEAADRRSLLGTVIGGYWKPLYYYLLRRGWEAEGARDAVQGFFVQALQNHLFERADRTRGRFRSFLLTAFKNHLASTFRAERASKRHPDGGFESLGDSDFAERDLASRDGESPEVAYHRAWVANLTVRVLQRLQEELLKTGKAVHLAVFTARIAEPALSETEAPTLAELAAVYGISPKEAANRLLTARRAFVRLLRAEVAVFSSSSREANDEAKEILSFLLWR